MLAVLEESIQAGALLRPKNGYLVWSRGASSARAPSIVLGAGRGAGAEYSSCIIFVVQRVEDIGANRPDLVGTVPISRP